MRQFYDLLPAVKSDFDSFENEVKTLEIFGCDSSLLKKVTSTSARVDLLESGISEILDLDPVRRIRQPAEYTD